MARLLTLVLVLLPQLCIAQDSAKLSRLELDVQQLQREVLILSQLVTQLRGRIEAPRAAPAPSLTAPPTRITPTPATQEPPRWLDADRWRNLRAGMTELEVISALGPPTSTRGEAPDQVLLYALEIASGSFLAGSVQFSDRKLASIEVPVLK